MSGFTTTAASIANISLRLVTNGIAVPESDAIKSGTLFENENAMILVVRRPGCPLCREHAQSVSDRIKSGEFANIKLFGIIKEVAPCSGVETDEELGVSEFQTKYFLDYPVYMDSEREFYSFLGNRKFLEQKWFSWNPFALWSAYNEMTERLKRKGVEGNMKGDYNIQGGLLIVSPTKGVVYQTHEITGVDLPINEIKAALDKLNAAS